MPELSRLRRLGAAVFAVYYHTQWEERGLAHPALLPRELSIPSLDEAVEQITREFTIHPQFGPGAARLTLAQLVRASAPSLGGPDTYDEHVQRLKRLLSTDQTKQASDAAHQHPDQRFVHAFSSFGPEGFGLRNFCKSWSYSDCITDICVSVELDRPYEDFPGLLDPRNWARNVPLVWEASDALASLPESIYGPFQALPNAGPFTGKFYEVAMFGTGLVTFATYRNLLNISIDGPWHDDGFGPICSAGMPPWPKPTGKSTHFCYTQYDCLETHLLGLGTFYGGIDVDRGFGMCEELPDGWCRLSARKRARFDQPPGILGEMYNGVASIYLPMLIEALVLFAAII